jgi:hypothetical protein
LDVYKTKNGRYFELDKTENDIRIHTEFSVKRLLKDIDPDLYMTMFNEKIEEA